MKTYRFTVEFPDGSSVRAVSLVPESIRDGWWEEEAQCLGAEVLGFPCITRYPSATHPGLREVFQRED